MVNECLCKKIKIIIDSTVNKEYFIQPFAYLMLLFFIDMGPFAIDGVWLPGFQ